MACGCKSKVGRHQPLKRTKRHAKPNQVKHVQAPIAKEETDEKTTFIGKIMTKLKEDHV